MSAIIGLIIQYLPNLIQAGKSIPEVMEFVRKTRDTLKQTKELTPEEEAAFDAYEDQITSQEHWKPEKE